jgi:hypothetical protein
MGMTDEATGCACFVIFAKAGIHFLSVVIPAKAGIHSLSVVILAKAGIHV